MLQRDQQPVLGRSGDRIRVDWGWFWLAAPQAGSAVRAVSGAEARKEFAVTGQLTTIAMAPAEPDPGIRTFGPHGDGVRLIYLICKACHTIRVTNQSS